MASDGAGAGSRGAPRTLSLPARTASPETPSIFLVWKASCKPRDALLRRFRRSQVVKLTGPAKSAGRLQIPNPKIQTTNPKGQPRGAATLGFDVWDLSF